jgi:two-component system response regulator
MPLRIHEPVMVMLVEDTADDEAIALRALRQTGLPLLVRIARDGQQAVQMLELEKPPEEQERALPKLILCDLKLPKLNGHEVLKRIKSNPRTANVPVVIFSSSDEESDVRSSYTLGANSYVRKPVAFEDYLEKVKNIATYWLDTDRGEAQTPFCEFGSKSLQPQSAGG